jgi:hypothetical protein
MGKKDQEEEPEEACMKKIKMAATKIPWREIAALLKKVLANRVKADTLSEKVHQLEENSYELLAQLDEIVVRQTGKPSKGLEKFKNVPTTNQS